MTDKDQQGTTRTIPTGSSQTSSKTTLDPEKMIRLSRQSAPMTPFINKKIEEIVKDIRSIYNFWNITIANEEITHKESGSYKYEIIFKLADFLDDYIFVGRIAYYIRNRPYKFSFETFLVNVDMTPVCIKNENTKFLTKRHILKLNSLLRFGSFSVDGTGLIQFHLLWNYETNAHLAFSSKEGVEKWMKISLATTMSTLKVNMTKLLMMIEVIDKEKYNSVVAVQGTNIRQIPKFFHDDQEKLKNDIIEGITKKLVGNTDAVQTDELPQYAFPFYQTVKIKSVIMHGRLTVGGYGSIHVVKAVMELEEQNKTTFKDKYFLVKVPRQVAGSKMPDNEYVMNILEGRHKEADPRINIERAVLRHPKDKCFQHICRYYDDILEIKERPALYMENYMPQNLHEFNAKKDLSMGTKLSWLYQLSHVLRYFSKNQIVHIDLKPSNIVVAKNFFLKTIDFAESMIKGSPDFKNEKRATTMPFSAPETLSETYQPVYESDVFSFAHIAYELFAGRLMVGFKRSAENKLRQKYKKNTYKLLPIVDILNFEGPRYLMQYMYFLIMLCTAREPTFRFPSDVLVNVIKLYALFSEKLF